MEYAIVDILGKQYQVQPGQHLTVDRLPSAVGDEVQFDTVLLHATDGEVAVGNPYLSSITVTAKVVGHVRGRKITVLRFRAKSHYHKSRGHRQEQSTILIQSLGSKNAKQSS